MWSRILFRPFRAGRIFIRIRSPGPTPQAGFPPPGLSVSAPSGRQKSATPKLAAEARHRTCHPHRESLRRASNRLLERMDGCSSYIRSFTDHNNELSRIPNWRSSSLIVPRPMARHRLCRGAVCARCWAKTGCRGSEELGMIAPFWPVACAIKLQQAAPFGSWLQGPGVNLQRGHGDEAVEGVLRDE